MKVCIDDIKKAKERIYPYAVETPLITNYFLDQRLDAKIVIKAGVFATWRCI